MINYKFLKNVDKPFELHDTTIKLSNLYELKESLEIMNNETFRHHVNGDKNDFAVWVNDAVGDRKLAKELTGVTSRKKSYDIVKKRINSLHGAEEKYKFAMGLAAGIIAGAILTVLLFRILNLY